MRWFRSQSVGVALAGVLLCSSLGVAATELPPTGPGFGDYELVPLLTDEEPYEGPSTPTSLDGIWLSPDVGTELDAGAGERLAQQGFVVMPGQYQLLHDLYTIQYQQSTPVFVTTDAAYHYWHLVFDKILRDLEQERLLPALERLVKGMRKNAADQRKELAGTALDDDAARVHDLMATTAAVLGLKGKLSRRARAEQALIEEHSRWATSPILDTKTDYSLFTPRGHYTRSEELERYFVALSVLGQHAFELPRAREAGSIDTAGTDRLRRGILASRALVGDPELEELWRTIFEPTAFLVGVSDDYTPFELAAAVESVALGGCSEPLALADDESIEAIGAALRAERPVRIDPERPSVRIMGTRFVLDSWILDQLVAPNVGPTDTFRVLASAQDLAAAFGSDFALAILDEAGATAFPLYPEQMERVRDAVASRPDDAWGDTVYDAWLAALEPMWLPHEEAFPDFMRSDAWATKAHQTGFGSYAELKHDTILYTKQPTADTGGGGRLPPSPRHWVEPDPVPFARLSALARLTRDGLLARELLSKKQRRLLTDYIRMVDRFEALATDELAGKPISVKDNDWLRGIGFDMERLWAATGDEGKYGSQGEKESALVADIMRGLDPDTGIDEVLEIGTGYFDRIYVLVPDDEGEFQVARGGVYSYYEFPWPTSDRLTDERWRAMLREGAAPVRPAWQDPLFPTEATGPLPTPQPSPKPTRRAIEKELGASIDSSWEPYRRSPKGSAFDPFEYDAVAGVIFDELERDLHEAVDYVALFRFPDDPSLYFYWEDRLVAALDALGGGGDRPCLNSRSGYGTWTRGEYFCHVSASGTALLRWTDERTNTYGVMNAVSGTKRLKTLARQWEAIR